MPQFVYWTTHHRAEALTGRIRFRDITVVKNPWFGERTQRDYVVLQVEETYDEARINCPREPGDSDWESKTHWRDATALEISSPKLRWVIDGNA
jgi:hypothetical protein